jgi:hypothetical protein
VLAFWALVAYVYETKRTNDITERAMDAQTRPWVGIVGNDIKPSNKESSPAAPSVEFFLKNYGRSPANRIGIVFFLGSGHRPNSPSMTSVCQQADEQSVSLAIEESNIHLSIFPDDVAPIRKEANYQSPASPMNVQWLIGCIAYQAAGRDLHHHTRVRYRVQSNETTTPNNGIRPIASFELMDTDTSD